jgi:hypothetical protein
MCIFIGVTRTLQRREGKRFYTIPQKLAVENYPVETETSGFRIGTSSF